MNEERRVVASIEKKGSGFTVQLPNKKKGKPEKTFLISRIKELLSEYPENYENLLYQSQNLPILHWETFCSNIPEQISPSGSIEIRHKEIEENIMLELSPRVLGKFGGYAYAKDVYHIVKLIRKFSKDEIESGKANDYMIDFLIQDESDENYKYFVWMSDTPKEYYEMWGLISRIYPKIDRNKGLKKQNIIIGGLGLGLLPNLLALRNDIEKILVIELNKEIINIVKDYLSPKIQVVNEDFFSFMEEYGKDKLKLGEFFQGKTYKNKKYPPHIDCIIVDIWSRYEKPEIITRLFFKSVKLLEDYFSRSLYIYFGILKMNMIIIL